MNIKSLTYRRTIVIGLMAIIMFSGLATKADARDFVIELIEENYKETNQPYSYDPLIYHSIQVNSPAGPKILVLTGTDRSQRRWLRHYMSSNKHFVLKVDPAQIDTFISASVFKTDLAAVHPFDPPAHAVVPEKKAHMKTLMGSNYILVVDTNETRSRLFKTVSKKMGYTAITFKNEQNAMRLFMLQPEKFKMISINHSVSGAKRMVEKVLSVKHNLPIVIETGYKNRAGQTAMAAKYEKFQSVHVTQVVLNDLQNTIKRLVNNNA